MSQHENQQLRDPETTPTGEVLATALGKSYTAYEALQDTLPQIEMEQTWQWYTPHKAWLARGQHFWTTPRGTSKEKTLYWLYVFEGYFDVVIWFKEKNRAALLGADVSDTIKERVRAAETPGKVPTFPVIVSVTAVEALADVYTLIDWKKKLER